MVFCVVVVVVVEVVEEEGGQKRKRRETRVMNTCKTHSSSSTFLLTFLADGDVNTTDDWVRSCSFCPFRPSLRDGDWLQTLQLREHSFNMLEDGGCSKLVPSLFGSCCASCSCGCCSSSSSSLVSCLFFSHNPCFIHT